LNRKKRLRRLFLEGKIMFTQNSMDIKTFSGLLLALYAFFTYLCLSVFVFHVDELELKISEEFLFTLRIGFFALFYLFVSEWFAAYLSIDSESETPLHYQVVEKYIQKKIKARYLWSFAHSLLHFLLLLTLAKVIQGKQSIFLFFLILLPTFCMGGVATVFASLVFPKFNWLEACDIPTYKSSLVMGSTYTLWLTMAAGVASRVIYPKIFYFLIFLYWFFTIVVVILLLRVSPIILEKKLFLTLETSEEGKKIVKN